MFNFKKTIAASFAATLAMGFMAGATSAATTNGLANGDFELAPSAANPRAVLRSSPTAGSRRPPATRPCGPAWHTPACARRC